MTNLKLKEDVLQEQFLKLFSDDRSCKASLSDTLEGLDLDSMDMFELILLVEETFNTMLDDSFRPKVTIKSTLSDFLKHFKEYYYEAAATQ
jgi:acyl carrier protein